MTQHKIYNDIDSVETQEWLDALTSVIETEGTERAHFLLEAMIDKARRSGSNLPYNATTAYVNTIPTHLQAKLPGDPEMERRVRALVRWNAIMTVLFYELVPLTGAAVRRPGRDVSLITYGGSLPKTLAAAEKLAGDGIEAEVIDLRCLRPLDDATVMASVRRTRRAVIVDEGWRTGSLAAEISARIVEQVFYELDAPPARVCSAEVPIPYPKHLEDAALPQVDGIVAAARGVLGRD